MFLANYNSFTFQYVSINTSFSSFNRSTSFLFTFQYVSINTERARNATST